MGPRAPALGAQAGDPLMSGKNSRSLAAAGGGARRDIIPAPSATRT
jgi:hypothetical protein